MSQPIRSWCRHFVFPIGPKKKLGRGHWNLASCQVSLNSVQRSRKCLRESVARAAILFFLIGLKNTNLVDNMKVLLPVKLNSFQWFQRRSRKCLSQSEARATILFFRPARKNTNLVEDIEILLPVKCRWIPFSGPRGEVVNVSANQRPGRSSFFFNQPEKHKLGKGRWYLASCQVSLNSVQQFQRRSRKCLSKSETRPAILFFRSAWKTQTW